MALGDALHEHDDATGDDDDTTGPGGKPNAKDAKKKHRDNMLIIGIALVGVILTYLIYRSNKNASSSTTTANPVPSTGTLAGGSSSTTATDPYAEAAVNQLQSQQQQQTSALQGLQTALTNLQDEVTGLSNTPATAPPQSTSPASPTPASPGLGLINLPGIGQSVILGELGQNSYTGYQVSGGAPVYFGNANGVSQGSGQEVTGSYAYTPIAYQGLVGSSSSTGGPLPGQH